MSDAPGLRDPVPESVVIHTSWRGIAFAGLGVAALIVFSGLLLVVVGPNVLTVLIAVVAVVGAAVVLLDMPIASVFDRNGVTRRALLRREWLSWDDVIRLTRLRRGAFRDSRDAPAGGLVAIRGRRHYYLSDRMEGRSEYEQLRAVLADRREELLFEQLAVPPQEQPPTWLYRRSKWAPENADRR